MQSYAAGDTSSPLIELTIGAHLELIVDRHGEREALVEVATGRRWTYAELDADVDRLARGLLASGVAKGDRVGIWAPNCAEWTLVQYATAKVGAVLVNVNPAYRTHELGYVLGQSGLRLLVSAQSFRTSDYRAMVEEVAADGSLTLERVVYLGTDDWSTLLAAGEDLPYVSSQKALSQTWLGGYRTKAGGHIRTTKSNGNFVYRLEDFSYAFKTWLH